MIGFKDRVISEKSISKEGDSDPLNSKAPLKNQEINKCTFEIISLTKFLI